MGRLQTNRKGREKECTHAPSHHCYRCRQVRTLRRVETTPEQHRTWMIEEFCEPRLVNWCDFRCEVSGHGQFGTSKDSPCQGLWVVLSRT